MEAYKQSMDMKSKDDILFLYKTADNIDEWVYKMFAAIFAAAYTAEACVDFE